MLTPGQHAPEAIVEAIDPQKLQQIKQKVKQANTIYRKSEQNAIQASLLLIRQIQQSLKVFLTPSFTVSNLISPHQI